MAIQRSLEEILGSLVSLERLMDEEDFDPSSIVGEISVDRENLKFKVDAIDFVIREFEAYGERTKARADNLIRRANSAKRKADSLRTYLLSQMKSHGFEKLSGNERYVQIRVHHTPAMIITRPAEPADWLQFGEEFVEMSTVYEWKTKALKEAALLGELLEAPIDLRYSEKIVFDDIDLPRSKRVEK